MYTKHKEMLDTVNARYSKFSDDTKKLLLKKAKYEKRFTKNVERLTVELRESEEIKYFTSHCYFCGNDKADELIAIENSIGKECNENLECVGEDVNE